MPFDYRRYLRRFSKEERQKRVESRLNKRLEKERGKTERYLALSAEDKRLMKLRKEIEDTRGERMHKGKKRKVRIGGFNFTI